MPRSPTTMPLPVFEIACIAVIALALFAMARRRPFRELLADYAALAIAGYLGEETCVALYHYYTYAGGWHGRIHHVPVLVPLIWPLVVLSARDVGASLWPRAGRWSPLVVGAIVAFDASLVEVIAVRAGLWSWAEPGHLGVPVIGMVGWGYFAIGADLALSLRSRSAVLPRLAAIALGPLAAHVLILVTWWAFFRWFLRRDLGSAALIGVSVISAVVVGLVVLARRQGRGVPPPVFLPRLIAAGLFFALLGMTAPYDVSLWIHTAAVAIPYFASMGWQTPALRASSK